MIRTFMVWPVLLGFTLVCLGCAKNHVDPQLQVLLEKPDWVSEKSSQYPKHLYLTGHGVSANLDTAKRQAQDEIASRFRREIKTYFEKHASGKNTAFSDLHEQLTTEQQILSKRQIAEIWRDPYSKAYNVLALIDRAQVGNEIEDQVNHIDTQIHRVLKKAGEQTDALQRIAFANIALDKIEQYEQFRTVFKILNPGANLKATQWTPEDIKKQVQQWLSGVKVLPVLENDNADLKQAFSGGVKKAGFIIDYGAKPDFVLKARFKPGQVKWNDGIYTLDGNLRLELLDGDWKQQVRGTMNWPIHVIAMDRDMLNGEVAIAIKQLNEQKLKTAVIELGSD